MSIGVSSFDGLLPDEFNQSTIDDIITTPSPPFPPLKCNQYISENKTHIIYGGYEGIPENLLINFIGWIILLALFTVLRKNAWNYGRLALVQKYENRWTQLFYGSDNDPGKFQAETDSISSYEFNVHIDRGHFSWIPALFKITDEHILAKSGRDAVQYLSFQRHIIIYMMIVCAVSIAIILPINFQGDLEGGEKEFGHTTMKNLSPNSPLMWVHITLAFLFLPLGIIFTRNFSKMLNLRDEETTSISRTIMITHVPRRCCHKDTMLKHFQEAYPEVEVKNLQFAYNIRSLIAFDKEREVARNARLVSEAYFKNKGVRMEIRPYKCGLICACCDMFGCPKVDAIEYYAEEEARLAQLVENEKIKALRCPTGVAFVTFDTVENAMKVLRDHQVGCRCLPSFILPSSSVSHELKPQNWIVNVAPAPEDIYWANLAVTTRLWYLKAFIINLVLCVLLLFFTTPAVAINFLDNIPNFTHLADISPVLSEFLPTLLLWTMAALMPVMVSYSDQFMSHWTRSAENHIIMRKTFSFLLLMVIILPSLGLTSAKALIEWVTRPDKTTNYRWDCFFLPNNGAFFVNYVITSAFIGTMLELIRFPELFMYMIRLGLARSEAETASVQRAIFYEFPFGVQYAWMMLIFAMTIIYSVSCPLITPFGLLYMIFKNLVDKYNIYFAYGPSKINQRIHTSAINFVMVSIVFLQLCLLFFSVVRLGLNQPLSIYSVILLCITCLVFMTHNGFYWFKDFSPIKYKAFTQDHGRQPSESNEEYDNSSNKEHNYEYVPPVLRDSTPQHREDSALVNEYGQRTYGTRPIELDVSLGKGPAGLAVGFEDSNNSYQNYTTKRNKVGKSTESPSTKRQDQSQWQDTENDEEEETLYTREPSVSSSPIVRTLNGAHFITSPLNIEGAVSQSTDV